MKKVSISQKKNENDLNKMGKNPFNHLRRSSLQSEKPVNPPDTKPKKEPGELPPKGLSL